MALLAMLVHHVLLEPCISEFQRYLSPEECQNTPDIIKQKVSIPSSFLGTINGSFQSN